jgi:glucose-1-phosphate cytidylyltransferase
MKVIILCGGVGTRLKEETEYKPKPMVYVGNKPILWHIMKIFSHYQINDFILALGYKADYIKDFFLNQKSFSSDFTLSTKTHKTKYHSNSQSTTDDFNITFVDTGLEALTGERILKCAKYIPKKDRDFIVAYGDCVADINIDHLIKFHRKQNTIGTTSGVHPRTKYGRLKTNNNNIVISFEEKPPLSDWVNGGFMVFKREALKFFKKDEMDYESLKRLTKIKQLSLYHHEKFWFAIDTYKELEDINKFWNTNYHPWAVWK